MRRFFTAFFVILAVTTACYGSVDLPMPTRYVVDYAGVINNANEHSLNGILQELDQSPAKAVRLSELSGLDFDHVNFGRGKIRMVLRDDIVKVKIKIGSVVKSFSKQPDVIGM